MEKRMVAAIAGVVWLSGIASAAAISYTLNKPARIVEREAAPLAAFAGESSLRPSADEIIGTSVLEIPTVTIVGEIPRVDGLTEMQGADDVIIGPGTVTYP